MDKAFTKHLVKVQDLVETFTSASWSKNLRGKAKKGSNIIESLKAFKQKCEQSLREDLLDDIDTSIDVVRSALDIIQEAKNSSVDQFDPTQWFEPVDHIKKYVDLMQLENDDPEKPIVLAPDLHKLQAPVGRVITNVQVSSLLRHKCRKHS